MIDFVSSPSSTASAACIFVSLLCLLMASGASGEYEIRETEAGTSTGNSPSDRVATGAGNEFRSCTEGKCTKRTAQEITGGVWFGPRLGRRRRSDGAEKLAREFDSDIETIANIVDGGRWALITVPGEKRQSTRFTPRLGRDSGEDYPSYISNSFSKDREDFRDDFRDDFREDLREDERGSSGFFTPRLGRRVPWSPSPRLGRRLRTILRKI